MILNPQNFHVKVRIYNRDINFGKGVAQLLSLIAEKGSLSAAYKAMSMSSSKAWKILHRAENDLGFPLVESISGGKYGGSTKLTKEGAEILKQYILFEQDVQQYAKDSFRKYFKK